MKPWIGLVLVTVVPQFIAHGTLTGVGVTATITSPTSSTTYDASTSSTVTIAGTILADRPMTSCSYSNSLGGSGSATLGSGTWTAGSVALTVGSNVVTVTCTDNAGTIGTDVITITRSSGSSDPCLTATCYYLDPDVTAGTHVGTQANPFQTQAQMWTAANTVLAAGTDVYLYCSARGASSDTDQSWPGTVQIYQKTTTGTARFTLDGNSKYNTSDSAPSWTTYSGTSKCAVTRVYPMNGSTHVKRNNVTISGIHLLGNQDKAFAVCGDNWIVEDNDIEHVAGTTQDPLFILMPTADNAHEGSGDWCPPFTNGYIQDNVIHDSYGELMYLGGVGCSTFETVNAKALGSDCNGGSAALCPGGVALCGHDHITIRRNHIYNCGTRGAEGDCIDFKAGHTYFTLSDNLIEKTVSGSRCGVTQGHSSGVDQHIVFERNIFNCQGNTTDALFSFSNSWGVANGFTFRNNIWKNGTGGAYVRGYQSQTTPGAVFYNETFYNNSTVVFSNDSSITITIKNCAFVANNASGSQNSFGSSSITADHNGFSGTFGTTCTTCVSGVSAATAFTSAAGGDFTLPIGSPLRSVGTDLSATFTDDYTGATRVAPWDIGAYAR